MHRKLSILLAAVLLSLLAGGVGATAGQLSQTTQAAISQQTSPAQSPLGQGKGQKQQTQAPADQMTVESSPLAPVGSGFTYQGRLVFSGSPASGDYDFTFSLFDASSGGTQVGSTITALNQTLSIGTFTTLLDFGPTAFQGDARWLQIAVRPSGQPTFTTMSPRQALTAAPYAVSLVPGALVQGSSTTNIFAARNNNGGSSSSAVLGFSQNAGTGVFGQSINGAGVEGSSEGSGVYGQSTNGIGVEGSSTTGYSMSAEGNGTWQTRTGGGWAKALVRVGGGAITRCYNGQSTHPNLTAPCGFSIAGSGGDYTITFSFQVNDRFVSVVPEYAGNSAVMATVAFVSSSQIRVRTWNGTNLIDSAFMLIVY